MNWKRENLNFRLLFNNRFEEFYNLEAFIIFFINSFAQIDDDVVNKIAS